MNKIDNLIAPLFVSWQMTRDCNLACVHCCTDSAPGKALAGELNREQAVAIAEQIVQAEVPYAMLCGGEPLIVPHFMEIAEILGRGGVQLKIETNGHVMSKDFAQRLAKLPIRSIQISLDGDTQETYGRQRIGGVLSMAHEACWVVVESGMPLEITFAPTRVNIHEAEAVLDRAVRMGAFRFNTGGLMKIGTAAKLWHKIEPTQREYIHFCSMLAKKRQELEGKIDVCYLPFSVVEALKDNLSEPPATLLVLPDGRVKVAAPLPYICGDMKRQDLAEVWDAYRDAWRHPAVMEAANGIVDAPAKMSEANTWRPLEDLSLV